MIDGRWKKATRWPPFSWTVQSSQFAMIPLLADVLATVLALEPGPRTACEPGRTHVVAVIVIIIVVGIAERRCGDSPCRPYRAADNSASHIGGGADRSGVIGVVPVIDHRFGHGRAGSQHGRERGHCR